MRSVNYIRGWLIASWLSLAVLLLILCSHPAKAQKWTVSVPEPTADSIMLAGADTSRIENAFCLDVTLDSTAHIVVINAAFPVPNVDPRPENFASFVCPSGYAIAHRHLQRYEHEHGPSWDDWKVWRSLRDKPVAAVVIYIPRAGRPSYFAYGL